jgi:hypothetical protein
MDGPSKHLSPEQSEEVLNTLQEILHSQHFSKSKRYPALLEYCVRNSLDHNLDALKERVIGYEVFGRAPDYDSNDDPVVRIAAGEVRRRLAQYFQEHPNAPLQMDLPSGHYAIDFKFSAGELPNVDTAEPDHGAASSVAENLPETESHLPNDRVTETRRGIAFSKRTIVTSALIFCVAASFGLWAFLHFFKQPNFWQPLVRVNRPVVVLLPPIFRKIESPSDPIVYLDGDVRLNTAIGATDICGALRDRGKHCQIMSAETTTLAEIYNNPVVLVGAIGDPWVQRLMEPLRFQFFREEVPSSPRWKYGYIVDRTQSAVNSPWFVDFISGPGQKEYFIIARFQSETTDAPVVIAAGLGSTSSRSAADYLASPEKMAQILSLAPPKWKGTNFEVVCQLELIKGQPGHVKVLATQFW